MVDPHSPSPAPAPAAPADPDALPSGAGLPNLGGLDLLVRWGIRAHPAVRYAVAVLGVIAAAAIAIRVVPALAGLGVVQTIVILFVAMLALMVVFVFVVRLFDPKATDPLTIWTGRVLSTVFAVALVALVLFVGYVALTGQPCSVARRLGLASDCPAPPPPTKTQPTGQASTGRSPTGPVAAGDPVVTRLVGTVVDAQDDQKFMPEADVTARRAGRTIVARSLATGDFEIPLGEGDVGSAFTTFAHKDCYGRGSSQSLVVKRGDNQILLPLPPDESCHASTGGFRATVAAPVRVNPAQLDIARRIAVPVGVASAPLSTPTTGAPLAADWFDGQNWRYDLFYCQAPDGDVARSKSLASQLEQVLRAQQHVGQLQLKLWPARGTRGGYWVPNATVTLNVRPERGAVADALRRLWTPYLATGETTINRPVSSNFAGYMSIIVCRK